MTFRRFLAPSAIAIGIATLFTVPGSGAEFNLPSTGYSDIVKVGPGQYLGVFDVKGGGSTWLGLWDFFRQDPSEGISIDWSGVGGQPKSPIADMESICRLGPNEFLAAESSSDGGPHRIVRFVLDFLQRRAIVLKVYDDLKFKGKAEGKGNFEGMACVDLGRRHLLILGERGKGEKPGTLYTGFLAKKQTNAKHIVFKEAGPVTAPRGFVGRDISALYVDKADRLWAVATQENPDNSLVYLAGQIEKKDKLEPLKVLVESVSDCDVITGQKIEGLATPSSKDDLFVVSPENEHMAAPRVQALDSQCKLRLK